MSVDVFWAKPLILELASNFSSFFRCLQMVFSFSSASSPIHLDSSSPETDTDVCTVLSSGFQPPRPIALSIRTESAPAACPTARPVLRCPALSVFQRKRELQACWDTHTCAQTRPSGLLRVRA